jgi:hypothetical protein
MGKSPTMTGHSFPAVTVAGALAAGCAGVACVPTSVVVERKEERRELRTEVRGMRTGPTGAVIQDRREVIVPEYWMLGRDGRWYQLSEREWRAAEPGQPLSFCR